MLTEPEWVESKTRSERQNLNPEVQSSIKDLKSAVKRLNDSTVVVYFVELCFQIIPQVFNNIQTERNP